MSQLPVIPVWANQLVMIAILLFAWVRGGWPERVVGTTIALIIWFATLAYWAFDDSLTPPGLARSLALETTQTLIFVWVALRTDRYWATVAASVSVVSMATQILQLISPFHGWAYLTIQLALRYLALATVALGTWQTWQARRKAAAAP